MRVGAGGGRGELVWVCAIAHESANQTSQLIRQLNRKENVEIARFWASSSPQVWNVQGYGQSVGGVNRYGNASEFTRELTQASRVART